MNLIFVALALFSVSASAIDANTKFFDLQVNQESFLVGDTAIFHAQVFGKPENPDFEFDVLLQLNSSSVPVTRASDFSFLGRSQLLNSGTQTVSATVYMQDKSYAAQLKISIQNFQQKIQLAQDQLEEETDPERIGELNAEIAKYTQLKNAAEAQLSSIRTKVRGPISRNFTVN